MVAVGQNIVKATGTMSITSLNAGSNGDVLVFPNTALFTYNANITVQDVRANTNTGVSMRSYMIETAADPELEVEFPITPIIMQMLFNSAWADAVSQTVNYSRQKQLTSNTIAAQTAGNYGFSVVANQAGSTGHYIDPLDPTKIIELTLDPDHATFNPAVDVDSFAVGAAGEILISDNVVALSPMAHFVVPFTAATTRKMGTATFDLFKVEVNLILVDLSIVRLTWDSLQVKPDNRAFDPATGTASLTFAALNDGSVCSYNPTIQYLGQSNLVSC